MTSVEPTRRDSTGTPVPPHQVADTINPEVQAKLDSWFGSELEAYNLDDVKQLGRSVI